LIEFIAILQKFAKKGEKTGWTYFEIPAKVANKIKAGEKKAFFVKGKIDAFLIKRVSILPMGKGNFIMPVNAAMRKGIKKPIGEKIVVKLQEDRSDFIWNEDFLACLKDDKQAKTFFDALPGSHQKYYSKWIDSAKTNDTKAKRIAQAINGFKMKLGYAEMLRYYREHKI
jgi:hypothetical protein